MRSQDLQRSRRLRRFGRLVLIGGTIALSAGSFAAPVVHAATGLTVTTAFPGVVVKPGATASFALKFAVDTAKNVELSATGAPTGWRTTFRGGGNEISGVFVDPKSPPDVTLDVVVPADAQQATSTINVRASSGGVTDSLPITVKVATEAGGEATLTAQFPEVKGSSTDTFTFSLTLKNDTAGDLTFALGTQGPDGWTVTAKPSGQENATSVPVTAGSTSTITVNATAPQNVAAGTYPITVSANGGNQNLTADLKINVVGSYKVSLSTPNQNLNVRATAGTATPVQFVVSNDGTAPITNVKLSASTPTNWTLENFNPATIPSIDAGKTATVTGTLTPSGDAIAGDYNVTVTATAAEGSGNTTIRTTVETSQLFGIIGIALIVVVLLGLYWVFRTYGRR